MDWREFYTTAHNNYFKKNFPSAYKDHGIPIIKIPDIRKANGLQMMIKNFCLWSTHSCNRINVSGMRVEKVKLAFGNVRNNIKYVNSTTTKGTADLDIVLKHPAHRFGIPVKAEIKIGADKQSEKQKQYEQSVKSTGAIYLIVKTPEDWFRFYFTFFPMQQLML